jgi:ornithine cyclodeaminase
MTCIYSLDQIKAVVRDLPLTSIISEGFKAYSKGDVIVPPVGELNFDNPPGDTHIKYGYIKNHETYVIKIASGFYKNPEIGLPSSTGMMLVFYQKTGMLKAILLDEGYLTDIRTAVAGSISATCLTGKPVKGIGIIGTGTQARFQLTYLKAVTSCRQVYIWGRTQEKMDLYKADMERLGFEIIPQQTPAEVAAHASLIVTTTPSDRPLLHAADIKPGTCIVAMGSDTETKQELDVDILAKADVVVADAISQCRVRGEISKALARGKIKETDIIELGDLLENPAKVKVKNADICVADLTGVAVQDIQIATAVCDALSSKIKEKA